ncbi:hypothetical protein PMALA_072500, partial [Plasmodium malariae]
MDIGFT